MHSKLHGNVVHHGVELLLLVSMIFLLAIPKSFLTLKEFLYTSYNSGIIEISFKIKRHNSACQLLWTVLNHSMLHLKLFHSTTALSKQNEADGL